MSKIKERYRALLLWFIPVLGKYFRSLVIPLSIALVKISVYNKLVYILLIIIKIINILLILNSSFIALA